jgi:hypothetical protein
MSNVRRLRINWTGEQVIRAFKMRGEGRGFKDIATAMGCSDHYLRAVIQQKGKAGDVYPQTDIPTEVYKRAMEVSRASRKKHHKHTTKVVKPQKRANGVGASIAIGEFAAKCRELVETEKQALKYFNKETLDMVKLSISESA